MGLIPRRRLHPCPGAKAATAKVRGRAQAVPAPQHGASQCGRAPPKRCGLQPSPLGQGWCWAAHGGCGAVLRFHTRSSAPVSPVVQSGVSREARASQRFV